MAPGKQGKGLHLGWALVLISVAQLMMVLDGTIITTALPTSRTTSASPTPT